MLNTFEATLMLNKATKLSGRTSYGVSLWQMQSLSTHINNIGLNSQSSMLLFLVALLQTSQLTSQSFLPSQRRSFRTHPAPIFTRPSQEWPLMLLADRLPAFLHAFRHHNTPDHQQPGLTTSVGPSFVVSQHLA